MSATPIDSPLPGLSTRPDTHLTDEPAGEFRNGIDYVRNDHAAIRSLFASYRGSTDRDVKLSVAREIVTTVVAHASAEERTIYPLINSIIPSEQGAKHLNDMMIMDDQVNKEVLQFLDTHTPKTDSEWLVFDKVMEKFMSIEEEHLSKEEKMVLDPMNGLMTRDEKAELWSKFEAAKKNAPLHPHPAGGTAAMAAQVMHPMAGVMDRAAHAVSGMMSKVLNVGDKAKAAAHEGTEAGKQHSAT